MDVSLGGGGGIASHGVVANCCAILLFKMAQLYGHIVFKMAALISDWVKCDDCRTNWGGGRPKDTSKMESAFLDTKRGNSAFLFTTFRL